MAPRRWISSLSGASTVTGFQTGSMKGPVINDLYEIYIELCIRIYIDLYIYVCMWVVYDIIGDLCFIYIDWYWCIPFNFAISSGIVMSSPLTTIGLHVPKYTWYFRNPQWWWDYHTLICFVLTMAHVLNVKATESAGCTAKPETHHRSSFWRLVPPQL